MSTDLDSTLWDLPIDMRRKLAADESLLNEKDALRLANRHPGEDIGACGVFVIKLMKCGGIYSAKRIADIADTAGIKLMWGCMDESIISISAALHAAFSSPATRYIDLDGSLDLARDVVSGGFTIKDGIMRTTDASGLGVRRLGSQLNPIGERSLATISVRIASQFLRVSDLLCMSHLAHVSKLKEHDDK